MKKALSILAALTLASVVCSADGTVFLNNYDANKAIFYMSEGTLASEGLGVTLQILGGPVGGALAPINPNGKTNPNLSLVEPGFFDAVPSFGVVPGVADGAQAQFQVRAWIGADYASAQVRAESTTWTQKVGTNPAPPSPPVPEALQFPGLTLINIPEPSTIALGLLGAALLLIRRRS